MLYPKVFKVVQGSDAIFSCNVKGVSKSSPITFWMADSKKKNSQAVQPSAGNFGSELMLSYLLDSNNDSN